MFFSHTKFGIVAYVSVNECGEVKYLEQIYIEHGPHSVWLEAIYKNAVYLDFFNNIASLPKMPKQT